MDKRYFEYKEKTTSTSGEKFRLITQEELAKKKIKDICLNCLSDQHNEQSCPQKTCFKCGMEGHLVGNCPHKNDKITCFKCSKKGHKIYDCQVLLSSSTASISQALANNCTDPNKVQNSYGCLNNYNMMDKKMLASQNNFSNDLFEKDVMQVICLHCSNQGHAYCSKSFSYMEKDDIYSEYINDVVKIRYNGVYANVPIF